jgi:hypothetical protein
MPRSAGSADDLRQPSKPRRLDQFYATEARAPQPDPLSVGGTPSAGRVVWTGVVEPPVSVARAQRSRSRVNELGSIEVHHTGVLDPGSSEALDDMHAKASRSRHRQT